MSEYLLEIGSGELPYAEVRSVPASIERLLGEFFASVLMLEIKPEIRAYSTPGRVAVIVRGLPEKTPFTESEIIGPPAAISYREGNPAAPLIQFMKKNGVSDLKKIYFVNQKKGVYVACKKTSGGSPVKKLLKENIAGIIRKVPYKKTMFWINKEARYPRPVLWILSIFDGKPLPFDFGDIKASGYTYLKDIGKKTPYKKYPIKISGISDYLDKVASSGIILKNKDRKDFIENSLARLSSTAGADMPEYDDEFIDEITGLTETPFPVLCNFEKKFLKIPKELLSVVMRKHQRFFPLSSGNSMLPSFIGVANVPAVFEGEAILESNIKSGYSRVLSARLADADFFYAEDAKKPLRHFVDETKNILFYEGLGSYYDKTVRIKELGLLIAKEGAFSMETVEDFKKASGLLKFDLSTHVVYEFPEMQGVAGRIYAAGSGESESVSRAIEEHYYPVSRAKTRFMPSDDLSSLCSLADKLDTLFSFVMLKKLPTGESDPFYLRRAMIGVIEIILEKKYKINLSALIEPYYGLFFSGRASVNAGELKGVFVNFAATRFKNIMSSSGYKPDEIAAVQVSEPDCDFYTAFMKIDFISRYKLHEFMFETSQIYKRINNIAFKYPQVKGFCEDVLVQPEEKALIKVFKALSVNVPRLLEAAEYFAAMNEIYGLVGPVNDFFDKVLVMAEDAGLRNSRIGFLNEILDFLKNFCDFSSLVY